MSTASPSTERLESRLLLFGISFDAPSNTLHVTGGPSGDNIKVEPAPANATKFTLNGASQTFSLSHDAHIVIDGQGGNDTISRHVDVYQHWVTIEAGLGIDNAVIVGGDENELVEIRDNGLFVEYQPWDFGSAEDYVADLRGGGDAVVLSPSEWNGASSFVFIGGAGDDGVWIDDAASFQNVNLSLNFGAGNDALTWGANVSNVSHAVTARACEIIITGVGRIIHDPATELVLLNGGNAADTFNIVPQWTTEYRVDGGSNADRITVLNAGATAGSHQPGENGSGDFCFADRRDIMYEDTELVDPLDTVAPSVDDVAFAFNTDHSISVQFSEDVSASLWPGHLRVESQTGSVVPASMFVMSIDSAPGTPTLATWRYSGILPDGNYQATLLAPGVADASLNSLAANATDHFFVLAGDANHDGVIDFDDYALIDLGFNNGLSGFAHGDFNYDGVIDFDDYVILDAAFNQQNG
jgi:hypothetical protein